MRGSGREWRLRCFLAPGTRALRRASFGDRSEINTSAIPAQDSKTSRLGGTIFNFVTPKHLSP